MSVKSKNPILQVDNLTKIYGKEFSLAGKQIGRRVEAVKNVSFEVTKGEIFGFLGPNGAGKTTAMRSILNYLTIQEGTIKVFGCDYKKDSIEIRKRIGYIPGDLELYDNFTGNELIKYFGKFKPINEEFLAELKENFKADLTLKIRALSSGNRQQVGLMAALSSKPELLILDEPTSGLDPLMAARFHRILKKLKNEGHTVFLSSHNLAEVQSICDRVAIIKDGELVLVEKIQELKYKFLQNVKIEFAKINAPDENFFLKIPNIVEFEIMNSHSYRLQIKENIDEFLKLLSQFDIIRLTIEDASLEEIFLHYYE